MSADTGAFALHAFGEPRPAGGSPGAVPPPEELGGKGAGLLALDRLGLRTPAGVILGTSAGRTFLSEGWSEALERAVHAAVADLESRTGRRLGAAERPLLVSVRSGAARSMPGMMDTVVDAGMTPAACRALAADTGDEEFALDTYRRAVLSHAEVVRGASSASLAAGRALEPQGVDAPGRLSDLAARLADHGLVLPADPHEQVTAAVRAVFDSWRGERAVAYRDAAGLDHAGGTAVIIQAMVFGNLGERSGTGVAFTRDPRTGVAGLVGDLVVGAQGDDVVSGRRPTRPLDDLRRAWPDVWAELEAAGRRLEHHTADMVDIEFTVERGVLHLLQFRAAARSPIATFRVAVDMANDPGFPVDRAEAVRRCAALLAQPPADDTVAAGSSTTELAAGLAASPGTATGVVCIDLDDALDRAERGESVILVRHETSPADVAALAVASGLVTAVGGLMSHAAVVARDWGLPAVVGVEGLEIDPEGVRVGGQRIAVGSTVTVDGTAGRLWAEAPAGRSTPIAEVAVIEGWAAAARD